MYFISSVPGLPVYEMMDGSLRLPFSRKEKGERLFWWMSQEDMTKGISDIKTRAQFIAPFTNAQEEIDKIKAAN